MKGCLNCVSEKRNTNGKDAYVPSTKKRSKKKKKSKK